MKSYGIDGADFLARQVAGTPDGGSYQLGVVSGSDPATATLSLALLRLDDEGNVQWARRYGRYDINGKMKTIVGAAEATDGSVWVAGRSLDDRAMVFKLDASGQRVSYQILDNANARVDLAAIAADRNGGFVLAGTAEATVSDGRPFNGGDLWLVHGDENGAITWRVDNDPTDDEASELTNETVRDIDVDTNGGVTVVGQQYGRSAGPRFWVAHYHESGAHAFSARDHRGTAVASVLIPHVTDTHVDRLGLVAVGEVAAATTSDPYLAQYDLAYDAPGDVDFDDTMAIGSTAPWVNQGYVGVAAGPTDNHVLVAANRYTACEPADSRCGVLGGALRVHDADDGFAGDEPIGPTTLGLPMDTRFLRLARGAAAGSDYWLLVKYPTRESLTVLRLGGAALDVRGSFPVVGPDVAVARSGGVLSWTNTVLQRVGDDGVELWRMEGATETPLALEPIAVAPLADGDGGAMVAALDDDGAYLLAYGANGDLRAARRYPTLAIAALAPIDLDGDGIPGDAVLAAGEHGIARVRPNGEIIDVVSMLAPGGATFRVTGTIDTGGGRVMVPTSAGLWWLDAAGQSVALWGGGQFGGSNGNVTPDGGLWQVLPSWTGALLVRRYDRNGQPVVARDIKLSDAAGETRVLPEVYQGAARADGGLFVAGSVVLGAQRGDTCGAHENCADGLVVSIDPDGEVAWVEVFGGARTERFGWANEVGSQQLPVIDLIGKTAVEGGVVASPDGGVLLTGITKSYVFPRASVFSVRVDANGQVVEACAARRAHAIVAASEEAYPATALGGVPPATTLSELPTHVELELESDAIDIAAARTCSGFSEAPGLIVTVSGAGAVASTPAGVACEGACAVATDCARDCEQAFATDTRVDLVATPAAGSRFVGWGGATARRPRRPRPLR